MGYTLLKTLSFINLIMPDYPLSNANCLIYRFMQLIKGLYHIDKAYKGLIISFFIKALIMAFTCNTHTFSLKYLYASSSSSLA